MTTPLPLPRHTRIGILGGGQLGRMSALAAANLGLSTLSLDPNELPAARVVSRHVLGDFKDAEAIASFVKDNKLDLLTVEIEHVNTNALVALQGEIDIQPAPQTVVLIQDKFLQKQHFQKHGVSLGEFTIIENEADLARAGEMYGYPFMLKSRKFAYDGKGNSVVRSKEDGMKSAGELGGFSSSGSGGLYAEKWQKFKKELAVMVVRSRSGEIASYPVTETIQSDSICWMTETPAQIPKEVAEEATKVAREAISSLKGAGIFGVEMFWVSPKGEEGNGRILLNEVAPRPHNSGHYTIDGSMTSQFENFIRAIMGWPLGDTSSVHASTIMLNVLGEAEGKEGWEKADALMQRAYTIPGCKVHWYDKSRMKLRSKVGHINVVGRDVRECRARLERLSPSAFAALPSLDLIEAPSSPPAPARPRVAVIMGSDSDLKTMKEAALVLEKEFQIGCFVTVVSAHRTPERMVKFARNAHLEGFEVIIAGAGGAAHLPGMVASMTPLPVIGVPVIPSGAVLDGVDALHSIVQMPKGVPVATVAIGNATNAGILAARIIAVYDPNVRSKMIAYQENMTKTVLNKAEVLEKKGWRDYETA